MQHIVKIVITGLLVLAGVEMNMAAKLESVQTISPEVYRAVHNPRRLKADVSRDALRKPEKVLQFSAVKPGMRVLDFFAGGGYYSELLSYLVGEEGEVVAYNNSAYVNFAQQQIEQHYANQRLPNVTQLTVEVNELTLKPDSFDTIFMILAYHDIYYVDGSWPKIDSLKLRKQLYQALRSGGSVILVDHHAEPGSTHSAANDLHRIDPEIVKQEMEAVGFQLVKQANFLANPLDDLTKPMFDPAIRGKTNRFVFMFQKP